MAEDPLTPDNTAKTIVVGPFSQLRKLVLRGPVQTVLQLLMQKPGIQLDCSGVSVSQLQVTSSEAWKSGGLC